MEDYLDITRSVMISSPAGSGKTEKLARRYIALLKNGSSVERILAITFTDKAAAEMKERVLSILRSEDAEMFNSVRERMPRMRISTIHSFCLKLLRRFSLELGIDPAMEVMDSFNADILWSEAVYDVLLEDGKGGEKLFYELIRDRGIKGWNKLYAILGELHSKRPLIEIGVRDMGITMRISGPGGSPTGHTEKLISLYSKCLQRYREKKHERHLADYNDLELMAYEAISKNPEWQNILFSFDEHTDHILVDEFQDTSSLQWKIIDKLTEEWRAGMGSKRESGIKPSVFLVGDDKQSIYSFRGANVSIFRNAKTKLSEWLGDECHFIEIRENYRSLPAIIDFVNALFGKLMPRNLYDDGRIEYTPFAATRKGRGDVELLLLESEGSVRDCRKGEASVVARSILELHGSEIHDNEGTRRCSFSDIAILLRSRTHLLVFEDALRKEGIPFAVVKGIGFYHTPEVSILKNILFFLIDPLDDYSLFALLRSPIFSLDHCPLFSVLRDAPADGPPNGRLLAALSVLCQGKLPVQGDLWEGKPDGSERKELQEIFNSLCRWLERSKFLPYSIMLEEILTDAGAWQYFHERQRYLNVKKFIALVEEFESKGLGGMEIREKLMKASGRADEPKANVNTEDMDAVRLMTIHASKGLQFPVVFLPCLDEESRAGGSSSVALTEEGEEIRIFCEDDSEKRRANPLFREGQEKIEEEEKRLFYVGTTRAMNRLCMSGVIRKGKFLGRLSYLADAFGITPHGEDTERAFLKVKRIGTSFSEMTRGSAPPRPSHVPRREDFRHEMVFLDPIDRDYKPLMAWHDVTEEIESIRRRHGEGWVILGRAFHRLFEFLSSGTVVPETMGKTFFGILRSETVSEEAVDSMADIMERDMKRLEESGYLREIILPQEDSYSELPFILQRGSRIYRGRIDRIIVKGETALVYDYKTYPVSDAEIPELCARYSFQMGIYREAVEKLLSMKTKAYLFFTHELKLAAL